MDVLYFLKERTRLIREYYEHAAHPFNETLRTSLCPTVECLDRGAIRQGAWTPQSRNLELLRAGKTVLDELAAFAQLELEADYTRYY